MALPANLLLLNLLRLPEVMPSSLVVTEMAGLVLGTSLGVLGDHTRSLANEIHRRKDMEARLRFILDERTLLLREIHHRVKNNLNVIHSLIGLQLRGLEGERTVEALKDLSRRIYSMSIVHDQLNDAPYTGSLDLGQYIPSLMRNVIASHASPEMAFHCDIADDLPTLSLNRATTLGLILNEVASDSLKRSFTGVSKPAISLQVSVDGENYHFIYSDNGGIPSGIPNELGRDLIRVLARQLDAEFRYNRISGKEFVMQFPLNEPEDALWNGSKQNSSQTRDRALGSPDTKEYDAARIASIASKS